jgi:hypothetical protein
MREGERERECVCVGPEYIELHAYWVCMAGAAAAAVNVCTVPAVAAAVM